MSTSAEIHINGNGRLDHDHILRPRAVKPGNPAVLRAMSEDGLLAPNGTKDLPETGVTTGQTRSVSSILLEILLTDAAGALLPLLPMRHHRFSLYRLLGNSSALSNDVEYSLLSSMLHESRTSTTTATTETSKASISSFGSLSQ